MRELVAAMRGVADDARRSGVARLRARADEEVKAVEAAAERRREELRTRAEADIAGVGEWARSEAERIRAEAEQRVAARKSQLEQQLAAETTRSEEESKALRARVAEYERELEAFHAQLSEITDPAAFAAAVKRLPAPPTLTATGARLPAAPASPAAPAAPAAPAEPWANAGSAQATHGAGEEVLAGRLAELDRALDASSSKPNTDDETARGADRSTETAGESPAAETTEIVVKGLGSFGAITGFRQALASQDGVTSVALSLGQTGEFVFRATHAAGLDMAAAITAVEGESARVEPRPEGGLRVTLHRTR